MKSFLIGSNSSAPTTNTNNFVPFVTNGSYSWSLSSHPYESHPLPHAITLDMLRVKATNAPGTGKNAVFTVYKNGVATALTCTVSGTNTTAQDLTHSVSFAAGDTIQIVCDPDIGSASLGTTYWTARQDASGLYAILGVTTSGAAGFFSIFGKSTGTIATGDAGLVVPCSGTIENLFIATQATGVTYTIYKNGVATSLAATSAGAGNPIGSDTTHSFTVAAGDRISIKGSGNWRGGWGVSFAPDIDGNSFIGNVDNNHNNSTTATNYYQPLADGTGTWDTTETNVQLMLQACTVTGLYAQTSVSPGASPAAYTFKVRQNATDTSASVTVSDASASPPNAARGASITGQSVTINDDDMIDVSSTPSGSPLGLHPFCSILINVSTPAGSTTQQVTRMMMGMGA